MVKLYIVQGSGVVCKRHSGVRGGQADFCQFLLEDLEFVLFSKK